MPEYGNNQPDVQMIYDGCTSFNRVSSFFRVSIIEPDALANAINMDVDQGSVTTRRGIEQLGIPASVIDTEDGDPLVMEDGDPMVTETILPSSRVQGLAFLDTATPTLLQRLLAIINANPYQWDGSTWTALTGYTAPNASQRVKCVPLIDRIFLATSGSNLFSWDGTTFVDLGSGTNQPKQYSILCAHKFRLFGAGLPDKPDTLECSDILDGTTWKQLTNSSRVGGGDSDPITALCSWTDNFLVVGKRNSVWLVNADPTQQPSDWQMKAVVEDIGCVAQESMCRVANDVFWLSVEGVRSLQYTLQGLTQGVEEEPISRPIQDIIDRINWAYIDTATATYWKNRYFLSIPLDTSTDCNAVLVYNTITKGWAGTWTGLSATNFAVTFFNKNARLVMGRTDGIVAQWMDYISPNAESLSNYKDLNEDYPSLCDTRGMNCQDVASPKQGFAGEIEFWKSLAAATVSVSLDGAPWVEFWNGASQGGSGSKIGDALPWTLNIKTFWRIAADLIRFGSWRELQFRVQADAGKIQLRSVYVAARLEKFNAEINLT